MTINPYFAKQQQQQHEDKDEFCIPKASLFEYMA
jgi:hypothetical protein